MSVSKGGASAIFNTFGMVRPPENKEFAGSMCYCEKNHSLGVNLNLPGTPNTSSEYYMERAACANDGFEKKEIKSKTIFIHKFLEFCYFWFLS